MTSKVQLYVEANTVEELHAKVLAALGRRSDPSIGQNGPGGDAAQGAEIPAETVRTDALPDAPTAEVVPIAERKKPGRPKKAETVIEAEPAAKNPEPTVEDARAVLKDIQTKIGNEEARQLNKKHGEEPLSEKKPAQWAAIIAEGKTLLAALDAE